VQFLVHDRDSKFTAAFNSIFQAEGAFLLITPYRAPNANAFAERPVRTVREECLNQILILNDTHLRRVLKEFIDYYHHARPHQGLNQQIRVRPKAISSGAVRCRHVLGGLNHDYYRAA
jgi:transposase InsO family protein